MPNYNDSKNLKQIRISLDGNSVCIGKEELTVDNYVKQLIVPSGTKYALLAFESDAIGIAARFFESGDTPSSTSGIFLTNGEKIDITNATNISRFKIIQAQSGVHKLTVQYYK